MTWKASASLAVERLRGLVTRCWRRAGWSPSQYRTDEERKRGESRSRRATRRDDILPRAETDYARRSFPQTRLLVDPPMV